MYALGKTKVFFRTGQIALLERLLHVKSMNSTILIQKIWRGYTARKKYQHLKESLLKIQVFPCKSVIFHLDFLHLYEIYKCQI